MRGKAKVVEYLGDAFDINVVEETQDIEEENGGDKVALDCSLCVVDQAKGSVCGAVVVAGSELEVGEDVIGVGVGEDTTGDDLLKELTAAFKKADGAIGFRKAVVGFVWLRHNDNECVFLRMESKGDGHVED